MTLLTRHVIRRILKCSLIGGPRKATMSGKTKLKIIIFHLKVLTEIKFSYYRALWGVIIDDPESTVDKEFIYDFLYQGERTLGLKTVLFACHDALVSSQLYKLAERFPLYAKIMRPEYTNKSRYLRERGEFRLMHSIVKGGSSYLKRRHYLHYQALAQKYGWDYIKQSID